MRPGYTDEKDAIQKRLRRIEGQVRGLQRMVDEDRYCIDILEQVAAVTRALQAVALGCSTTTSPTAWPTPCRRVARSHAKLTEASAAMARMVRS